MELSDLISSITVDCKDNGKPSKKYETLINWHMVHQEPVS